jgi:hypothetical protein
MKYEQRDFFPPTYTETAAAVSIECPSRVTGSGDHAGKIINDNRPDGAA